MNGYPPPVVKSTQMFLSPGDPSKGLGPTNPPCANNGDFSVNYSNPYDAQVPKISYTVNAARMPLLRLSPTRSPA